MSNRKRILTMIVSLAMVLILFVSSAYIVREAGHECAHEHCEICETIARVEALLHFFAFLAVVLCALAVSLLIIRLVLRFTDALCLPARPTLVSWKIRLDN